MEIEDAWKILTNEEKVPPEFLSIVSTFQRCKSVYVRRELDEGDFATCAVLYGILNRKKRDKNNG